MQKRPYFFSLEELAASNVDFAYATTNRTKSFVYLLVPSLPFCHEKATVALYSGRIRTHSGVVHFPDFLLSLSLFLPLNDRKTA